MWFLFLKMAIMDSEHLSTSVVNIIIAGSRDISERMPYSGNCILSLNYVNFEILNALSNIKASTNFWIHTSPVYLVVDISGFKISNVSSDNKLASFTNISFAINCYTVTAGDHPA